MKSEKNLNFEDYFNCKIFALDSNSTNNNYVYVNTKTNHYIRDLNLPRLVDKLINEQPQKVLEFCDQDKFLATYDDLKPQKISKQDAKKEIYSQEWKNIMTPIKREILVNKKHVFNLGFKPIEVETYEEEGLLFYNIYRPKIRLNDIPKGCDENSFPTLKPVLLNFFGGKENHFQHWLNWISYKAQNPCKKIQTSWIIQDEGGTGKSKIMSRILGYLFNVSVIGQEELESPYNHYMVNATMILAEEIEGYENEKRLKKLTGGSTIQINEKFKANFDILDYTSWMFFSNEIKTIKIDEKDRRFNVVGGGLRLSPNAEMGDDWSGTFFGSKEKAEEFFDFLDDDEKFLNEVKNFISYVLGFDAKVSKVWEVLVTQKKKDMQDLNKTSEKVFIDELKEAGIRGIIHDTSQEFRVKIEKGIFKPRGNDHYVIVKKTFFLLYLYFCRESNYRPLNSNHFFKRLAQYPIYNEVFGEEVRPEFEGGRPRCLVLNDFRDDNDGLVAEMIDMEDDLN